MTRRPFLRIAALALSVLVLAGCGSDPLADQYREGSGKDYIAGDGTIQSYDVGARSDPVTFEGNTTDDAAFSSDDYAGDVLVLNFWYASCPPCRAEARDLQQLSSDFADQGVQFVGVNTRDEAGTARSFEEQFGIEYPSILDYQDAAVQLAFSSNVPPNALPSTLVLDREGRVAARFLGAIDPGVLRTLITDTLAEKP